MPILNTGQQFASGDQVTSQKLMDIAGLATFDDPADGVTIIANNATYGIDAGDGKLRVKTAGISSNELATDSVTEEKIKDGAVTSDKLASTAISAIMPTGSVIPFAGLTLPGNTGDWLFCDGSEYSETGTYSNLFSVIQSTYNTGGETTAHFRVPDLRGRVVGGKDNMGGTSSQQRLTNLSGGVDGDTLGATGGSETHTLIENEIPSHNHGGIEPAGGTGSNTNGFDVDSPASADSTAREKFTTNTGGDQPHNNVQPTIILNYIIKT